MSRPPSQTNLVLGIVLVLLSAVGLAAQNIISRLFFVSGSLFGQITLGGWIAPQPSTIVMLLALRMGGMALLLAAVLPVLYPHTQAAIRQLPKHPKLIAYIVGSGLCLTVGLISLYVALSQVAAGIAIATFFIYPAITLLLAWPFLHQRPRRYQLSLMLVILLGVVLTTASPTSAAAVSVNPTLGILSALCAGLSFGIYGIFAELVLQVPKATLPSASAQTLHPVPFSLLTFVVVSSLSAFMLLFMPPVSITAAAWPPVLAATVASSVITVVAYVLNNSGIRYIGASLTALVSTTTPALTALFAVWTLQETLQLPQLLGIGLVTIGVATLSLKAKQHR
ncbi:MAG: putative permease [Phormidesmis priestleyi Ana]|uniref:Putative permease n=1 Tax=Phormidesmis priestleyi Ana TaxID=1666911 RepID=A0A0P7YTJ7_9CYAN|nr:MAG: putative permease [Phormidesmis priestleyi Ana]